MPSKLQRMVLNGQNDARCSLKSHKLHHTYRSHYDPTGKSALPLLI